MFSLWYGLGCFLKMSGGYFRTYKSPLYPPLMLQFHISRGNIQIYSSYLLPHSYNADRAIWPLCDNTDITSRYHSSADKAIGVPGFSQIWNLSPEPFYLSVAQNKQPVIGSGKRRRSQWKTTGCQRGHSTGRYLYVFVGSGCWKGDFFPVRGVGVDYLFICDVAGSFAIRRV